MNVLFVCVANSGRSVMAENLFRRAAAGRHHARSAGTDPGTSAHPRVVDALREVGLDASGHVPRKLDQEALAWADVTVSTCSEEVCPVTPRVRRISWVFEDPQDLPLERVREIRREIERNVEELVHELDAIDSHYSHAVPGARRARHDHAAPTPRTDDLPPPGRS